MAMDNIALLQAELNMHSLPEGRRAQLQDLLDVAARRLARRGISLDPMDPDDIHLQVEYAAWLYRRRSLTAPSEMPKYLRMDINDRLISEKARA